MASRDNDSRSAATHRTRALAERLRARVGSGEYAAGRPIPSERELAASEGLSRTTVRRAIELLIDAGALHRVPGSGTYVGPAPAADAAPGQATIGMIVPSLANPYFGELVTAIERAARRSGYQLLLGQADQAGHSAGPYLERYAANPGVRGVIAVSESRQPAAIYQRFAEAGKPLAFVVRHAEAVSADSVSTDHVGGARALTAHLIGLGHRRIAFIGGGEMRAMRHYQGYLDALRAAAIPADPALQVEVADVSAEQAGAEGVRTLLERGAPFTAIFAQIDLVAVGVRRALRAARLRVPQDVALVGFDNIPSAAHLDPPLTTVDHSVAEIGRLAVLLLEDRISGRYDGPPRRVIIQPRLVIRESCGMVPLTPSPSPTAGEGSRPLAPSPSPPVGEGGLGRVRGDRWPVPEPLRRKMVAVARGFRRQPTPSEAILWESLRDRRLDGRKFRRQQPLGPFVVDFFCADERLIVEVDGPIHEAQRDADRLRQELIESLGLRFVRVAAADVERSLPAVLAKIRAAFTPSPALGEGAGG